MCVYSRDTATLCYNLLISDLKMCLKSSAFDNVHNFVSYQTEKFSKLIIVRKILLLDLVRNVKIVIRILKNSLKVVYERFKQHILCFEFTAVKKYNVLKRGFRRSQRWKLFSPRPPFLKRKKVKKKRRKNGRPNIGKFV